MLFYSVNDTLFMRKALALASRGTGRTSPNPMVGAVLVKNGRIIAADYHRKPGSPHAEALVITKAGHKAKSSTLYVNLEPCCHTDKRTPPCTGGIIKAGIKRVVAAMSDPNPKVSGKGFKTLRDAGIVVETGILEKEARRLNEAYVKFITTKRPFVVLKTAMTLDGRIAAADGQSKWITGEPARRVVHRLRSSFDAVLTAIGTVKADDPQLTSRINEGRNPVRIVIDPRLEISRTARILSTPPRTIIVTKKVERPTAQYNKMINYLLRSGITILIFKEVLKLSWLLRKLAKMEITSLMIEGGPSLNAHAIEEGIVDKVIFFIAPKILGGDESYPSVGGKAFRSLEDAFRLEDVSFRRIGEDFMLEGYLTRMK